LLVLEAYFYLRLLTMSTNTSEGTTVLDSEAPALAANASVVFDNNAYSGVGCERLRRIQMAEVTLSVRPLASLVVAQELLAGVLDADDERRVRTRRALLRLWRHCQEMTGERPAIRFVADVDSQIRLLHQCDDGSAARLFDLFGGVVGEIGELLADDLDADLSEFEEDLNDVSGHVAEREIKYQSDMRAVAAAINTGTLSIETYRASAPMQLIVRAIGNAKQLENALDPDKSDLIRQVNTMCAIGIDLHVNTLRRIQREVTSRIDANTLWDEEICCATSLHSTINQSLIILVTEEKKLRACAEAAGAGDRVVSLSRYETLLGLAPWLR
jgi:hypothetical protein